MGGTNKIGDCAAEFQTTIKDRGRAMHDFFHPSSGNSHIIYMHTNCHILMLYSSGKECLLWFFDE